MSLIIDINPVPWKILELVKARILKNRAKKKKVDQGFSATAIRREINAQQGVLVRKPKDEPSFIPSGGVVVGVGWLHIGENYTVTSDPPGPDISASLEIVLTVGTRSGEIWKQARHTVNYSQLNSSSNFHSIRHYSLLPAGQSDMVLVYSITQFQFTENLTSSVFNVIGTKQISFLITDNSITELTHPVPVYAQRLIDYWEANGPFPFAPIIESFIPQGFGIDRQGELGLFNSSSSGIFESILPEGASQADANTFIQLYSPQQAKASYAAFSGNSEIPVLGYKRDDPSVARTPTTERGVFGIVPGASVTAPVTAEMNAADLDDVLVQEPGPNAENRPEPVQMIVAYDYHGGTYCRDQLAALGITLP